MVNIFEAAKVAQSAILDIVVPDSSKVWAKVKRNLELKKELENLNLEAPVKEYGEALAHDIVEYIRVHELVGAHLESLKSAEFAFGERKLKLELEFASTDEIFSANTDTLARIHLIEDSNRTQLAELRADEVENLSEAGKAILWKATGLELVRGDSASLEDLESTEIAVQFEKLLQLLVVVRKDKAREFSSQLDEEYLELVKKRNGEA